MCFISRTSPTTNYYGLGFTSCGEFPTDNRRGGAGNDALRTEVSYGGGRICGVRYQTDGHTVVTPFSVYSRASALTDDLDSAFDGTVIIHDMVTASATAGRSKTARAAFFGFSPRSCEDGRTIFDQLLEQSGVVAYLMPKPNVRFSAPKLRRIYLQATKTSGVANSATRT